MARLPSLMNGLDVSLPRPLASREAKAASRLIDNSHDSEGSDDE